MSATKNITKSSCSLNFRLTDLFSLALQLPKITTDNANVEVLTITNVSATVGGMVTTLDGNRVSMLCEVSGVPVPEITWERDDVEVQRGGVFYTIETAAQEDSGRYTCIATNIGGEVKATSQLKVLGTSEEK